MWRRNWTRYTAAAATVPVAGVGLLVLHLRQKPRARKEAAGVSAVQRADAPDLAARLRPGLKDSIGERSNKSTSKFGQNCVGIQ